MPVGLFEQGFSGNYPKVLAQKMMFAVQKEFFWGRWAKFNTPGSRPVRPGTEPMPIDSPIVIQRELGRKSGDILEIPVHRNLKNMPRLDKQQMKEFEEEPKVNFVQVAVNLFRHAEKPQDSTISTQVNKDLRLLENAIPALQRHYARVSEYEGVSYAFYNGYSGYILRSARWSGHAKIAAVSHPHIYTSGSGKVSYSGGNPGVAGYETTIGTDITAVGSGDVFDTGFLNGLKADPQIRKIPPIILNNGNHCRFIVAHPYQIAGLEADSTFKTTVQSAYVSQAVKDNPLLYGAKYYYAGFFIFENDTAVWPVSVTGGKPVWGVSGIATITSLDSYENYASETKFGAIVLGSNAMFKAIADNMEFKRRRDDYDEIIGIAYRAIEGYARGDAWNRDDGDTGEFVINDNSAIAVTYAATPGF